MPAPRPRPSCSRRLVQSAAGLCPAQQILLARSTSSVSFLAVVRATLDPQQSNVVASSSRTVLPLAVILAHAHPCPSAFHPVPSPVRLLPSPRQTSDVAHYSPLRYSLPPTVPALDRVLAKATATACVIVHSHLQTDSSPLRTHKASSDVDQTYRL